ncbi:MAG TPA: DUF167 domain-containing protein [Pirellulales bacterium]|nr:DUF167 domain-containing protein [Pirellulales bacterium]
MIALKSHADGVVLPVRAQPGARRNCITGEHDGHLKVSVTAAPDKGKANQAIIDVLCEHLSLARSQVELLSGATSRIKQFLVRGVSIEELGRRLIQD